MGKTVSAYTLEEAKDIRRQMADRGFVVSAVGSPIGKVDITAPFEPHLALFKHTLDVAHALDTPYIRMFSFFMPAGQPAARYRGEVLDRLGEMIRLAQDSGIVLLHENEKEIYGDVASRCWDLMTQLGCEHFAATYDFLPTSYSARRITPWPGRCSSPMCVTSTSKIRFIAPEAGCGTWGMR